MDSSQICYSLGKIHNSMSDRHPVSWAWMHECMDDLTTKRDFDSQTMLVIDMLGKNIFKFYSWMFIESGIGGRLVGWCMNQMSVL